MEIDRWRQLRVEIVAAPPPPRLADHGRQMIERKRFELRDRFVAHLEQEVARTIQRWRRAVEVDVVLHAQPGIRHKVRAVGETFQDHELYPGPREFAADFGEEMSNPGGAFRVVGEVPVQPLADRSRKLPPKTWRNEPAAERQSQLRA